MQKKRKQRKPDIGFYILLMLVVALAYYVIYGMSENRTIDYSEARQLFLQERVKTFWVYDTVLTMEVRSESGGTEQVSANIYSTELFWDDLGDAIRQQQEDGIITIVVAMDSASGEVVSGPDIITRGFVYVRESEDLIMDSQEAAMWAIENCLENDIRDWSTIKQRVRDEVSHVVYDKTKRSPMILPIIMEV